MFSSTVRSRYKTEALRDVTELRAHLLAITSRYLCAADAGASVRRPNESAEHADGGRFAGAVRAEESEDRTAGNVQREFMPQRRTCRNISSGRSSWMTGSFIGRFALCCGRFGEQGPRHESRPRGPEFVADKEGFAGRATCKENSRRKSGG